MRGPAWNISHAAWPRPNTGVYAVGTQGTVKGVTLDQLRATGAEMILGNTYHLSLRPGEELIRDLGGLHRFCGWDGPILTDSGGFQLFSLAEMCKITEERATFRSHHDGSKIELSPERSIAIQEALGSDVMMVLDHVIALPAEPRRFAMHCYGPSAGLAAAKLPNPMRTKPSLRLSKAASIPICVNGAPANSLRWNFRATRLAD